MEHTLTFTTAQLLVIKAALETEVDMVSDDLHADPENLAHKETLKHTAELFPIINKAING